MCCQPPVVNIVAASSVFGLLGDGGHGGKGEADLVLSCVRIFIL